MSTIIPTEAQQGFPQTMTLDPIVCKEKSKKFVRSASIERIIQFNSYICAQHYYLMPSIITWFKSSHTILQSQIIKCIIGLKSIFLSSLLYTIFVNQCKICVILLNSTAHDYFYKISNSDLIPALEMLYIILHHSAHSFFEKAQRKFVTLCIYFTFFLIFSQLAACIFLLSEVFLPAGLIFLCTCLYLIAHLNGSVLFHYLKREENKLLLTMKTNKKPKKFVLGNKTISNLNLF